MKRYNVAIKSLMSLALVAALGSCDKNEERILVSAQQASVLKLSTAEVAIDKSTLDETALTLEWTATRFSYDKVVANYELLITRPTQKAEAKDTLAIELGPNMLMRKYTHLELNQILTGKLKLATGVAEELNLQIRAIPYTTAPTRVPQSVAAISSAVKLKVTPADIRTKSLDYFFVGSMFGDEHKWQKDYAGFPFFLDTPDGKAYTYTGKFAAGAEFKIDHELNLGVWDKALGTPAAGKLELGKGDNIKDATAGGYFTVSFDPEALTYSAEPFAGAEGATVYKSMGLIGSSVGGWDNDVDLTQASYDPHIWKAERIEIATGELKIRANDAWDKSWGGTSFPVAKSDSGDNIKISAEMAGAYFVVFNDLTGHYHFRKLAK